MQLGVSWIWVGLESPQSGYAKLKDADTRAIVADLRQHGIKLLGSTIVGLEHHTPGEHPGGDRVRRLALHRLPPVHAVHTGTGHAAVRPDDSRRPHARRHRSGRHPRTVQVQLSPCRHLARRLESNFSTGPFVRTSKRTAPASSASARRSLTDGSAITNHPDPRVRARFAHEARKLRTTYNAALWAMEKRLKRTNRPSQSRIRKLRREIEIGVRNGNSPAAHGCSARCCSGLRSARTGAWLAARPTSRRRSSSDTTGWKKPRPAKQPIPSGHAETRIRTAHGEHRRAGWRLSGGSRANGDRRLGESGQNECRYPVRVRSEPSGNSS